MEKADSENKLLIDKLAKEYSVELDKLGARVDTLETRMNKADKVTFSGMVRGKYDNEKRDRVSVDNGNKHFYFDFEGAMKVNDKWTGHFQSETEHHYGGDAAQADGDGTNPTFKRVWATGTVGDVGVTFGKKWTSYGYNVAWGVEAKGIWLDFNGKNLTTSLFHAKPSWGQFADSVDTNVTGINFNATLNKNTHANLLIGYNNDSTDSSGVSTGITNWGELGFDTKLSPDFKLTGVYARTNADEFNSDVVARLDYKGADLNVPGSYGIFLRYLKLQKNGDPAHDDEWGSLPRDSKGFVFGVDYTLDKNINWETIYAHQKVDISANEKTRKLFRTQLDLHF